MYARSVSPAISLVYFKVEFWTLPSREGVAVDIRVSPTDAYNNISEMLASSDMKFAVQIPDLQSAIEGEDDTPNMKRELLSWFEKYHPLDEVGLLGWLIEATLRDSGIQDIRAKSYRDAGDVREFYL